MYIDAESTRVHGRSLWLRACDTLELMRESAKTLERLLSINFSVTETSDPEKWNCLFVCVLNADVPSDSSELEALRFLLTRFTDINATDASGRTISDHVVNADDSNEGSYQRDLWYCALDRTGMLRKLENIHSLRSQKPQFTESYTPLHLYALRYLDGWSESVLWPQVKAVLKEHPWSEEERNEMTRLFCNEATHADWSYEMAEEDIDDIGQYLGVDPEPWLPASWGRYWKRRASIHESDEESDADSEEGDRSSVEWHSCSDGEMSEEFSDHGQDNESGESDEQLGGRMISHDTEMADWQDTQGTRA